MPVTEKLNLPFSSKAKTTYHGNEVELCACMWTRCSYCSFTWGCKFSAPNTDKLNGDILLIFQPAEEGAPEGEEGGAELMLKQGLFEVEKPDAILECM